MTITTNIRNGQQTQVEQIFVKWANPFEELQSVAQLSEMIQYRTIVEPGQICIVVPNATWGLQVHEECEKTGIDSLLRIPRMPLSAKAKKAIALLRLIAEPTNEKLLASWIAAGKTEQDLQDLIERYQNASSLALLRITGISECVELRHAHLHADGSENAAELYQLIMQQWINPTSPAGVHKLEIVHYRHISRTYEQMFFIGCVDGLIPDAAAYADTDQAVARNEEERQSFINAVEHCTKRVFISGFQKADEKFADAAHIRYLRKKQEDGKAVVIARPTPYLAELGSARPSTMGGQALMRLFKLN